LIYDRQAKENADDLVARKKDLDAQVEAKRKQSKEHEIKMRQKASTAGNIVGKGVPVSATEVCNLHSGCYIFLHFNNKDDNEVLRTWHPDGPNGQFEKKSDIMPHHEVLLRLDAMDLDRGS
jgi:seryl-tRNA synthetase